MSRTVRTIPLDVPAPTPVRRGQRDGRPPMRRTGTRSAVIAAELAEHYGTAVHVSALGTLVDVVG